MQTYIVDTGYLQEEDAFDVNQIVEDWEPASNVFLKRSAANAQPGSQGSLNLDEFVHWVSEFARSLPPNSGSALDLLLNCSNSSVQVDYTVGSLLAEIDPPIEADNPGFLRFALNWCSTRRASTRIYVTAGLFWMEKNDK